jgi:hypothetical protein
MEKIIPSFSNVAMCRRNLHDESTSTVLRTCALPQVSGRTPVKMARWGWNEATLVFKKGTVGKRRQSLSDNNRFGFLSSSPYGYSVHYFR